MKILIRQVLFSNDLRKRGIQKWCLFFLMMCVLSSCASIPTIQPQINNLIVAGRKEVAVKILETNQKNYGANNQLLYLMDYGLLLHLTGDYRKSIATFEQAKKEYDRLYTVSISRQTTTWLVNDRMSPYRGEEFERVLINIFQALNYAVLGEIDEALVEARDVDSKLKLFNQKYDPDQKNTYSEDAFARLLMGIMYEVSGTAYDLNNAFISYVKALDTIQKIYQSNYGVRISRLLKENLLSVANYMGEKEREKYQNKFPSTTYLSLADRNKNAEIFFIRYEGFVPIKQEAEIPVPLPDGHLVKVAFPRYEQRVTKRLSNNISVSNGEKRYGVFFEVGENIGQIAMESLDRQRHRYLIKSALRTAGKYMLIKKQEENIREQYGENAGNLARYVGSLYQLASEKVDTRSWQTLPDKITIGRLIVAPGHYEILKDEKILQKVDLQSGDKKFIIIR